MAGSRAARRSALRCRWGRGLGRIRCLALATMIQRADLACLRSSNSGVYLPARGPKPSCGSFGSARFARLASPFELLVQASIPRTVQLRLELAEGLPCIEADKRADSRQLGRRAGLLRMGRLPPAH